MLGKRSEPEFMDDHELSQKQDSVEAKADFINRFMLRPENIHDREAFILKFFVDYEYPESQEYLKTFWKNLIGKTFAIYFKSVSGKLPAKHFEGAPELEIPTLAQ